MIRPSILAIFLLASGLGAVQAPTGAGSDDEGLVDWSVQPFSDQASHMVLVRGAGGFTGWTLRSAFAFGGLAAQPHPAKDLFRWRLELKVEGEEAPRFEGVPPLLRSFPRWAQESVEKDGLSAECTLLYPSTDVLVGACNAVNRTDRPLRLRGVLVLRHELPGLDATALFDQGRQQLALELNRSKLAGRRLIEHVVVQLGGGRTRLDLADEQGLQAVAANTSLALKDAFELRLALELPSVLAPGTGLRLPFLFSVAQQAADARAGAGAVWASAALPKGLAYQAAKRRWAQTRANLPGPAEPGDAPLLRRAALTLLVGEYARRGQLDGSMLSAAKGFRDCFSSVELPLASLGWAELDLGRGQQALLQMAGFSALAPAPVPPHTGEELLLWESTGLPLHGLAAFELYHRDPEAARANAFLTAMGARLRNECAYWPEARDGDGNGLYAFARDEEKPAYLNFPKGAEEGGAEQLSPTPKLQTWSFALSSLVAWQMQAAAALAGQASQAAEADKLQAHSFKTVEALAQAAGSPEAQAQGLDQLWPFILGLDSDAERSKSLIEGLLLPAAALEPPFLENGRLVPWRAYFFVRLLAQYGYLDQARAAAKALLSFLSKSPVLWSAYEAGGQGLGAPGDTGSAAAALELALERFEQEIYLTPSTQAIEGRWLQARSLDGRIYMKRLRLPAAKGLYARSRLQSLKGGSILSEQGFVLDCDEAAVFSLVSESPLQITELGKSRRILFKEATRADMIVRKGVKYEVILKEK